MKILITIALSFYSIGLVAQNENELKKQLIIKNNISEIMKYKYDIQTGDSILVSHNFFDVHGNRFDDIRYKDDGQIRFRYKIEYNEENLMTKQTGYNDKDSISTILLYEYDSKGNLTDYKQISPDGIVLNHQKREYNKKGQNTLLKNKHQNSDAFYLSSKYTYTKKGLYDKIESYNINGQLNHTSHYQYDTNENLIAIYREKDKIRKLIITNTYNDKNQRVENYILGENEQLIDGKPINTETGRKIEYKYDTEGNLAEELTFEKGELINKEKYFYKKTGS